MQAYWVTYLAPSPESPAARLEKSSGQYHHRALQQAASPRELVLELQNRGCTALTITPARPQNQLFDKLITRQYKIDFLTAIDYNMTAGLSASRAFDAVVQAEDGPIRLRLEAGLQVLARGGSFAEAVAATNIYDETTNILLSAGERTGDVKQSLKAAIEHYTSHMANMKGLMALGSLVLVDLVMAIPSVYSVRYQMLPMVEKAGVPQGTPEQLAEFASGLHWAYLINDVLLWSALIAGLLGLGLVSCLFDKSTRDWAFGLFQRIPVLGAGMRDSALSASQKALGSLLAGGVVLVPAIEITRAGVTHPQVAGYWRTVLDRLVSGDTVSRALRSELLDRAELLLLDSHQTQKQLADIMRDISKRRAEAAGVSYKRFGKMTIYTSIGYTLASALSAIYVYTIQASAMSAAL